MYAKDDSPAFLQQSSYLIDKAAFLEEGDWGAEGERGQWPIQRAGGAARNEQATGREHATIECRKPFFLLKEEFPCVLPYPRTVSPAGTQIIFP